MKLLKIISVLSLVAFGLITIRVQPRSDKSLISHFQKHRSELDQLVTLLTNAPGLSAVYGLSSKRRLIFFDHDGQPLALGISSNEFLRLLSSLNCDYVSKSTSEITIIPIRNGFEDLFPGGFKSFAFRFQSPAATVPSIDRFRRSHIGSYDAYQHLTGNWYLKYEEAH